MNKRLYFAWIVAVAATLGSLYFSEVRLFIPCELCWFQRIMMYPLSITLGIAAYRNDAKFAVYALPISILGGIISLYHTALQKIEILQKFEPCHVGAAPCSTDYLNWFGFLTIPMLALAAFALISAFLLSAMKNTR